MHFKLYFKPKIDTRSLFFRIAVSIGAAGIAMSLLLAGLYYANTTQRGMDDAKTLKVEMLHLFSSQIALDTNRGVTRRLNATLTALAERTGESWVYGGIYDKEGVPMVELGELGPNAGRDFAADFAAIAESLEPIIAAEQQMILYPAIMPNGRLAGYVVNTWDAEVIRAPIRESSLIVAGLISASFVFWTGVVILIVRRLVGRPLRSIGGVLHEFENQRYGFDNHDLGQVSELKSIQQGFESLGHKLEAAAEADALKEHESREKSELIEQLSAGLAAVSQRDLSFVIQDAFAQPYDVLRDHFNAAQDAMASTLGGISSVSEQIDVEINQLVSASSDLASRADNQAGTLSEIASSLDKAADHTNAAVEQARNVEVKVLETTNKVHESGSVVEAAVSAMSGIEQSSHEAQTIISVIEDIAFQTNLLAINASIEAARAGEAGRGFTVVAREVRSLSGRTTEAAKEIRSLISASETQVRSGASLVRDLGVSLEGAIERVSYINGDVKKLVDAFQSYASTLEQISAGTAELDQATRQSAEMAETMRSSNETLSSRAAELRSSVARFVLPDDAIGSGLEVGQDAFDASASDHLEDLEEDDWDDRAA